MIEVNNIDKELIKNTVDYYVDRLIRRKNVECIYFAPYFDTKSERNVFEISVIYNETTSQQLLQYAKHMNKIFAKDEIIAKYNGKFIICCIEKDRYPGIAMNPSEVKHIQELLSTTLIYDKNGEYYEIAHQFGENSPEPYPNMIDIPVITGVSRTRSSKYPKTR